MNHITLYYEDSMYTSLCGKNLRYSILSSRTCKIVKYYKTDNLCPVCHNLYLLQSIDLPATSTSTTKFLKSGYVMFVGGS